MKGITIFALFVLIGLACQTHSIYPYASTEVAPNRPEIYQPVHLQKMQWLAGAWKSSTSHADLRLLCQFHHSNALEIMDLGGSVPALSAWMLWQNDRFYFGAHRQWVITWIGEKSIRFDPAAAGKASAMTWVQHTADRWLLIRHHKSGDDITVMERAEEKGLGIVP